MKLERDQRRPMDTCGSRRILALVLVVIKDDHVSSIKQTPKPKLTASAMDQFKAQADVAPLERRINIIK